MRRLPGYAFAFGGSSAPLCLLAFCHFSILPPSSDGPVRFALDSQRGALLSHSADATTDDTTVCKWIPEPAPSSSAERENELGCLYDTYENETAEREN